MGRTSESFKRAAGCKQQSRTVWRFWISAVGVVAGEGSGDFGFWILDFEWWIEDDFEFWMMDF